MTRAMTRVQAPREEPRSSPKTATGMPAEGLSPRAVDMDGGMLSRTSGSPLGPAWTPSGQGQRFPMGLWPGNGMASQCSTRDLIWAASAAEFPECTSLPR
jgi:hypothetical protein